jgi:hypothetical protein
MAQGNASPGQVKAQMAAAEQNDNYIDRFRSAPVPPRDVHRRQPMMKRVEEESLDKQIPEPNEGDEATERSPFLMNDTSVETRPQPGRRPLVSDASIDLPSEAPPNYNSVVEDSIPV